MFKNLLAAAIVLALLPGCTSREKQAGSAAAPDFTLQDMSGKKVSLSGLKGSVVLLDFWATWCPPCREAMPDLERLHKTYGGRGLTVLAISMDEGGWDYVKSFMDEHKITFTVLQGTEDVSTKYQVRMIPAIYLVDKQGIVKKQYLGVGSEEDIEKEIKALL